jgi:hypothetical protein
MGRSLGSGIIITLYDSIANVRAPVLALIAGRDEVILRVPRRALTA